MYMHVWICEYPLGWILHNFNRPDVSICRKSWISFVPAGMMTLRQSNQFYVYSRVYSTDIYRRGDWDTVLLSCYRFSKYLYQECIPSSLLHKGMYFRYSGPSDVLLKIHSFDFEITVLESYLSFLVGNKYCVLLENSSYNFLFQCLGIYNIYNTLTEKSTS